MHGTSSAQAVVSVMHFSFKNAFFSLHVIGYSYFVILFLGLVVGLQRYFFSFMYYKIGYVYIFINKNI